MTIVTLSLNDNGNRNNNDENNNGGRAASPWLGRPAAE